ncbi:acyl-CoA dehydrogenase family protein [uncultured Bradyrhizobium sp.]|uniref:acyl-CoA dehydrogenase family protein n=1 Tax=uncultured Bradyrhizobium sp. TaxID=199684 RepID=UPI002624E974|nr:acyl-CoA dehydrogenase family protein [uncultured Bradyrhizobium sp.]
MDLTFSAEERAFEQEVRDYIASSLTPEMKRATALTPSVFSDPDIGMAWQRALHKKGWGAPGWPVEHGGPDWTPAQRWIFEAECARAGVPNVNVMGVKMVGPVIIGFGSPEQQNFYLPRILSGEDYWCQGYSEPGSGSDLASLKTRAERQGNSYVVNGQKTWTTLGQYGEWIFCLVRTSNEGKPQTGISFLLIDMKSPGITVRPIKLLDGECEVNEVLFDNVEVPAENLVGEENKGWNYAKFLLAHERTNIADVNRAKRELERLKRIAKAEGVWEDMRFRDEIAKLEVDVIALEMMVLRVLSELAKTYEAGAGEWNLGALPPGNAEAQTKNIVAFRIPLSRVETKIKLSQNRELEDRQRVIARLEASDGQDAKATARWMKRVLPT